MNRETFRPILAKARDILVSPNKAFADLAQESGGPVQALYPYAVVWGGIWAAFSSLSVLMGGLKGLSGLGWILAAYPLMLVMIFVSALILAGLAPFFKAKRDWTLSCRIVVASMTPVFALSVIEIIPLLGILVSLVAFLWSLVLLYMGIGRLLAAKGVGRLLLTAATVGLTIAIGWAPILAFSPIGKEIPAIGMNTELPEIGMMGSPLESPTTEADREAIADQVLRSPAMQGLSPKEQAEIKAEIVDGFQSSSAAPAEQVQ